MGFFLTVALLIPSEEVFARGAPRTLKGEYSRDRVVQAILLEAVGEGERGMYAVSNVFRNRFNVGLPLGSCGLNRPDREAFIKRQPRRLRVYASLLYDRVLLNNSHDNTGGATHFESTNFKEPKWVRLGNFEHTATLGRHKFYREIK